MTQSAPDKSSDNPPVLVAKKGMVGWLTINNPEVRNAIDAQTNLALAAGVAAFTKDPSIRAIVITGAGDKAFSAGGNLKGNASTFVYDQSQPSNPRSELHRVVEFCTIPIVARVNGHCLAGGMGVLSACDMVVAVSTATFGTPEVKIGMFPMQVAAALQHLVPRRKFMEMCITGEPITAAEALAMDLVNYVVPPEELDAKVDWLLNRIIDKSPTAIRRGKYALRAILDMNFEQSVSYMETQIRTLAQTEDAQEGLTARREKRAPRWTGR